MPKQLLIYEEVAPLSSERHRDWSVRANDDFAFARQVNSVPLTAIEFPQAAADFPIVFAPAGDSLVPVALLGIRAEQNLYVDEGGQWTGRYVPAFLRRYPFVFSSGTADEKEVFTLCIDEKFEGWNQEGRGERLFDSEGNRTRYLDSVLEFQREYRNQTLRTQAFCTRLRDLELLEPMAARVSTSGGGPVGMTGFQGIQRKKLHDLPEDKLRELSTTGELELAYVHLQSLVNFKTMIQKADPQATRKGASTN